MENNQTIDPLKILSDFAKGGGPIPDQLKGIQEQIGKIQDMAKNYVLKNEFKIVVNGKQGRMQVTNSGAITIQLENANDEDAKIILKRIHD